jgi:hypothetical protein
MIKRFVSSWRHVLCSTRRGHLAGPAFSLKQASNGPDCPVKRVPVVATRIPFVLRSSISIGNHLGSKIAPKREAVKEFLAEIQLKISYSLLVIQ